MRYMRSIVHGGVAALLFITGAHASTPHQKPAHTTRTVDATFTLGVAGTPDNGTTFWVAYGPLAGRFDVIQLVPRTHHRYSAHVLLPATAVANFTYLAGQGIETVHSQPQPGGTPVVIRTLDAVTAVTASQRVVHWSVPLG